MSIFTNLLSFFTLPYFINNFGQEKYSTFIVGSTIIGSSILFDFGLTRGLNRFTAEYRITQDKVLYSKIVSFTIIIFLIISIFFFFFLNLFNKEILHFFSVSSEFHDVGVFVLKCFAFYSVLYWLSFIPKGILEGNQKFFYVNISEFFALLLNLMIFLLVLFYQLSFNNFIVLTLCTKIISILFQVHFIYTMRLLDGVEFNFNFSRTFFQTNYFSYSLSAFTLVIISFFSMQADKYILGYFFGASLLTAYVVFTKPLNIIKSLNSFIFSALGPMVVNEISRGNTEFVKKLIKKGNLLLLLVYYPLIFWFILILKPFLIFWINIDYAKYALWGSLSLAIFLFAPFYSTIYRILINTDKIKLITKIDFFTVLINFLLSIILIKFIGYGSVILGTIFQAFLQTIIYNILAQKIYRIPFSILYNKIFYSGVIYPTVVFISLLIFRNQIDIDNWKKLALFAFFSIICLSSFSFYLLLYKNVLGINFIEKFKFNKSNVYEKHN